ncbi:RusA family crossover junction endodeoxyribonuclease [Acinetobacter sp. WCHAc060025]|uniref:RusA family crossover junction endodeoxyribonuclease n=1 Tax=Acinetobacter sp. WCHAc060025 TaxID=2518625 RepID=UPI00148EBF16|nr:RusA family crossover junction endodeoxyribonuclease [Acinetobacter sp. WCHAc060025]
MRWSEKVLEAHLKAHRNRANQSKQRLKTQNDAKVQLAKKNVIQAKSEPNSEYSENQVLYCEIAATPPSVNHYWERTPNGMRLTDRAKEFHAVVRAVVPALRLSSRLKIQIIFHFPTKQKRDLDNHLKGTLDSFEKCGFCEDDEQFDLILIGRGSVIKGGLIRVKIWEIEGENLWT